MTKDYQVVSKVLIYENDPSTLDALKLFCQVHNLVGLKSTADSLDELLEKNIDLGGVFVAEDGGQGGHNGLDIALAIHRQRPDLPIFLRRRDEDNLMGLSERYVGVFTGAYTNRDLSRLGSLIDHYIFDVYYPSHLIKGIEILSEEVLRENIVNIDLQFDKPYLVKDQIIFGELCSLIPLESNWCRGYMMMQVSEGDMGLLRAKGNIKLMQGSGDLRELAEWLSEITNIIWGRLKNRFLLSDEPDHLAFKSQVPIIMDLARRYISFGTDMPHLVLKYTVKDPENRLSNICFYQKFMFSLQWCPENMKRDSSDFNDCIKSGVLDLF